MSAVTRKVMESMLEEAPEEVKHELRECKGCAQAEVLTWAMWRIRFRLENASEVEVRRGQRKVVAFAKRRQALLEEWSRKQGEGESK